MYIVRGSSAASATGRESVAAMLRHLHRSLSLVFSPCAHSE